MVDKFTQQVVESDAYKSHNNSVRSRSSSKDSRGARLDSKQTIENIMRDYGAQIDSHDELR